MTQAILAKSLIISYIRIILTFRVVSSVVIICTLMCLIDVPHCVSITMRCRQRKGHFVGDDGQKQDQLHGFLTLSSKNKAFLARQ